MGRILNAYSYITLQCTCLPWRDQNGMVGGWYLNPVNWFDIHGINGSFRKRRVGQDWMVIDSSRSLVHDLSSIKWICKFFCTYLPCSTYLQPSFFSTYLYWTTKIHSNSGAKTLPCWFLCSIFAIVLKDKTISLQSGQKTTPISEHLS